MMLTWKCQVLHIGGLKSLWDFNITHWWSEGRYPVRGCGYFSYMFDYTQYTWEQVLEFMKLFGYYRAYSRILHRFKIMIVGNIYVYYLLWFWVSEWISDTILKNLEDNLEDDHEDNPEENHEDNPNFLVLVTVMARVGPPPLLWINMKSSSCLPK